MLIMAMSVMKTKAPAGAYRDLFVDLPLRFRSHADNHFVAIASALPAISGWIFR
jgi:hypothetical protein